MDFWQVVKDRTSVRNLDPAVDLPATALERPLQAALQAPSAGNRQPWHFYVVRNLAVRKTWPVLPMVRNSSPKHRWPSWFVPTPANRPSGTASGEVRVLPTLPSSF